MNLRDIVVLLPACKARSITKPQLERARGSSLPKNLASALKNDCLLPGQRWDTNFLVNGHTFTFYKQISNNNIRKHEINHIDTK